MARSTYKYLSSQIKNILVFEKRKRSLSTARSHGHTLGLRLTTQCLGNDKKVSGEVVVVGVYPAEAVPCYTLGLLTDLRKKAKSTLTLQTKSRVYSYS